MNPYRIRARKRHCRHALSAALGLWALVAVLLSLAVLSGCAHQPPAPVRVSVPVAVPCPPPPAMARPHLPLADLQPDSAPNAVMKAYVASIEALVGYARELEILLAGYRGPGHD